MQHKVTHIRFDSELRQEVQFIRQQYAYVIAVEDNIGNSHF